MKIALTGVLGKPSTRLSSHNAGYTFYILSRLKKYFKTTHIDVIDMNEAEGYDILILTEGLNYREGVFNLFGGISNGLVSNLQLLNTYLGNLYSFGSETIDYTPLVEKRISHLSFSMPEITKITEDDIDSENVILGDSHSLSVYQKGYALYRHDGKTMNGFLNAGLSSFFLNKGINVFRFYAGNIDVRHHLYRLYADDYQKEVDRMVTELEYQLLTINAKTIQVVQLLPIETEERKLPKTGYFEGQPFYGTVEKRRLIRDYFCTQLHMMCLMNDFDFLIWPDMLNSLGELDVAFMEARQSVHLAPHSYMFKQSFI